MSNTPNLNTPAVKAMSANVAQAIIDRAAAVTAAQAAGDTAVRTAEWARFHESCDALSALGKYLTGKSVGGKLSGNVTGDAIRKAFADKTSGLYVETTLRADLPSASTMSRAIAIANGDSAAHRQAFESAGNAANLNEYLPWLTLATGGKLSNASTVDVDKTVTGKGKSRKVGKLVRKPSARTSTSTAAVPIAAVVPEWGTLSMMSDDELAAIPTVADLSAIPAGKRADVARQLIAAILMAERQAAVETLAITVTV